MEKLEEIAEINLNSIKTPKDGVCFEPPPVTRGQIISSSNRFHEHK